jgi:hypothetical protein
MSVPKADMAAFCDITGLGNYSRKEAKGCNVIPATRGSTATNMAELVGAECNPLVWKEIFMARFWTYCIAT